ncbi:tryptophan-rich sensory protein [Priestia megaterium]|uniref:tryptophan-rich sensory protein n=1 Tax=Priestia megaterium TaxID=1404 RepID=UPI002E1F1D26|nr:tryptophan-rich sensory protein [Priestia megaterium]MED3971724.1 tryptophan-rich sensory protein [Priestia megaterium]
MKNQLSVKEKWMGVWFALGTLVLVMIAAGLGFYFSPPNENLQTAPSDSFFWVAWLIVIPTWGIATWLVWLKRKEADIRGVMVVYVWFLLGIISFFPSTIATEQNVLAIFISDVMGIVQSILILWLYSRYSKTSLYWLIPLVIWFPITTIIKFINL